MYNTCVKQRQSVLLVHVVCKNKPSPSMIIQLLLHIVHVAVKTIFSISQAVDPDMR